MCIYIICIIKHIDKHISILILEEQRISRHGAQLFVLIFPPPKRHRRTGERVRRCGSPAVNFGQGGPGNHDTNAERSSQ